MEGTMKEAYTAADCPEDNGYIYRDMDVNGSNGLHMRPASQIVSLADDYSQKEVEVQVYDPEDDEYKCVGMLTLMMLAASKGTKIKFRARGNNAKEALSRIADTLVEVVEDNP